MQIGDFVSVKEKRLFKKSIIHKAEIVDIKEENYEDWFGSDYTDFNYIVKIKDKLINISKSYKYKIIEC